MSAGVHCPQTACHAVNSGMSYRANLAVIHTVATLKFISRKTEKNSEKDVVAPILNNLIRKVTVILSTMLTSAKIARQNYNRKLLISSKVSRISCHCHIIVCCVFVRLQRVLCGLHVFTNKIFGCRKWHNNSTMLCTVTIDLISEIRYTSNKGCPYAKIFSTGRTYVHPPVYVYLKPCQ